LSCCSYVGTQLLRSTGFHTHIPHEYPCLPGFLPFFTQHACLTIYCSPMLPLYEVCVFVCCVDIEKGRFGSPTAGLIPVATIDSFSCFPDLISSSPQRTLFLYIKLTGKSHAPAYASRCGGNAMAAESIPRDAGCNGGLDKGKLTEN